ncbi:MAG TPA: carboxymuconolactone decarboxylase family protein [Pyrinomonadaceae bacterium]
MMMSRLRYADLSPEGFKHLRALSDYLTKSEFGESLLNLVYLRVSQINGCPYCVDLHWGDARASGEDMQKLNAVVVWRETPWFSERERAALNWAEVVTRLRDQRVSDEDYEYAKSQFTDKELVDLTLAVAQMNALNRITIAFHQTPVDEAPSRRPGSESHRSGRYLV